MLFRSPPPPPPLMLFRCFGLSRLIDAAFPVPVAVVAVDGRFKVFSLLPRAGRVCANPARPHLAQIENSFKANLLFSAPQARRRSVQGLKPSVARKAQRLS